jgi:hypothetical protein
MKEDRTAAISSALIPAVGEGEGEREEGSGGKKKEWVRRWWWRGKGVSK